MKIVPIVLASLAVFIGLAVAFLVQKPMWLFYHRELRTGNEIISRVDAFRTSHRHLPETLQEVGFVNADKKVFYVRLSEDEYCLWFGTTLGESETYRSHHKR